MRTISSILFIATTSLLTQCIKPECPDPQTPIQKNVSIQPDGDNGNDTYVSDYYPTANFSDRGKFNSASWTYSGVINFYRVYLNFNLSILSSKNIKAAYLHLYSDTSDYSPGIIPPYGHSTYSGPNDFTLRRVTSSWNEKSLTWNNQPTYDEVNKVYVPSSTSFDQAYIIDVTGLIKDQLSNPFTYYGFMFELNNHEPYRRVCFYSSNATFPQLRPKLVIEY